MYFKYKIHFQNVFQIQNIKYIFILNTYFKYLYFSVHLVVKSAPILIGFGDLKNE